MIELYRELTNVSWLQFFLLMAAVYIAPSMSTRARLFAAAALVVATLVHFFTHMLRTAGAL